MSHIAKKLLVFLDGLRGTAREIDFLSADILGWGKVWDTAKRRKIRVDFSMERTAVTVDGEMVIVLSESVVMNEVKVETLVEAGRVVVVMTMLVVPDCVVVKV